ncbi:acetyltransferase [Bordetella pertussis]|nr:acetyltransferase [Bordetella pertussis]
MAIDGEPKNGDFARYIEELSRTGGAPGQVLPAQRAPAAAAQSGVAGKLSELTWGKRPERTARPPCPPAAPNYLLHENTSTLAPVCYLQDLYVDPQARAQGAGRRMLDWLVDEARTRGWSRLYWNTRENNYRARALYDQYTPHSGFVRYVVHTSPPKRA